MAVNLCRIFLPKSLRLHQPLMLNALPHALTSSRRHSHVSTHMAVAVLSPLNQYRLVSVITSNGPFSTLTDDSENTKRFHLLCSVLHNDETPLDLPESKCIA